ncbi:IS630 family transposase [candidate division CSSED10-310 bacterium]|uniref:IS630 family transposase n=1 Tax=candidate division CSSED10-310 bacterium TaxID=2855610 RepID=A0ABV6YTF5_UNCC1
MSSRTKKVTIEWSDSDIDRLKKIMSSRTMPASHVQRAKILYSYYHGESKKAIARELQIGRPTVYLCIDKALKGGIELALSELPRSGRPPRIKHEDKLWVIHIACSKPKEFGYAQELWTYSLLAKYIRTHAQSSGHPPLVRATKSMIHSILNELEIRPHKMKYYLEQRDPEFEEKMAQLLCVYKEVQLMNERDDPGTSDRKWVVLCYDEKPGIQAIENTAPDLPPRPGKYSTYSRDHEYRRHGTLSLLAGIDLHNGRVLGLVRDTHSSTEFIEFLERVNNEYPLDWRIRIILDNHSAHISKQTMKWLAEYPNRFEFIFTPKHGSWLNLIESFFSKMARTFLRSIRVESKDELMERLIKYLAEVNDEPVVFRWKYKMDELI